MSYKIHNKNLKRQFKTKKTKNIEAVKIKSAKDFSIVGKWLTEGYIEGLTKGGLT